MSKTIVVVGGYWSTNIGNSFFQLGAQYILTQVFPNDRIVMLSDQPGFYNVREGNPKNAFNLLDHVNPDYIVLLGPVLRSEYAKIWHKTLLLLHDRGVKIIFIGAGMMRYNEDEIKCCRSLLRETPPFIFATRDKDTYHKFADLALNSYDGIDPAFFVSDVFTPIPINFNNYIIFNFDQIPEPNVEISNNKPDENGYFKFESYWWRFEFPALRSALSRRFKIWPFIEGFIHGKGFPKKIGDYSIIRTDHRFNPMLLRKTYRAPNSFVSDIPFTYLNLYANTRATFTNRVHACVATLAYGKPAMLFSTTPRARLLERVGLTYITRQPQTLPMENLRVEKMKLINFVKTTINEK